MALVSRAGWMARQVMGSSGGSTMMQSPLSDMERIGLVAVLLLSSGIAARSMFEEATVEGGRVTCHARKSGKSKLPPSKSRKSIFKAFLEIVNFEDCSAITNPFFFVRLTEKLRGEKR